MRILMTTFELFFKLLRYSWAFRERAWLGRAHRHRQLPTHNGHWWSVCYVGGGAACSQTRVSWHTHCVADGLT
jgi:hypothetical protein